MRFVLILLTFAPAFSFAAEPISLASYRLQRRLTPMLGTYVRHINAFRADDTLLRINLETEHGHKMLCVDEWEHGDVTRVFQADLDELPVFREDQELAKAQDSLTIAEFDKPEEYYGQSTSSHTDNNLLLEPNEADGITVMLHTFNSTRATEAWSVFSRVDLTENENLRGAILLTEQHLRVEHPGGVTPTAFIAGEYAKVKHLPICARALRTGSSSVSP